MNFNRKVKIILPFLLAAVFLLGGFVWLKTDKITQYKISADQCVISYDPLLMGPCDSSDGSGGTTPEAPDPPDNSDPANPSDYNTCGMDIALVMDMTASMTDTERTVMKTAMKSFVDSFANSPTRFALITFGRDAEVVISFSDEATTETLKAKIQEATVPTDGGTNWDDALYKAKEAFRYNNRPAKKDMIILASDGKPNYHDVITQQADDLVSIELVQSSEAVAMQHAVEMANAVKALNIKILGLAISTNAVLDNFKQISGNSVSPNPDPISATTDVITSDFSNLGTNLSALHTSMCSDSIVIQTQIDTDGDGDGDITGDTEDQLLSGYGYSLNGPSSFSLHETSRTGLLQYTSLSTGSYSIIETPKSGFVLKSAKCWQGDTLTGDFDVISSTINNINVTATNTTYCIFMNRSGSPQIGINVEASPTGVPIGGGKVNFSYKVINPSDVVFENVNVFDKACSSVSYFSGDSNRDRKLQNTENWQYACSMNVKSAVTSEAVVTGYYNNQVYTAQNGASVSVIPSGPPKTGK